MPRKPNIDNGRYNDPFPTILRQLMDERGTRQEDLISVLGVKNRQSVTGYRDGSTLPTIDKIVSLAKYFNVSTDYLLGLAETPSPNEDVRKIQTTTGLSDKFIEYVISNRGRAVIDGINTLLSDVDLLHELSHRISAEQMELKLTIEMARDQISWIEEHNGYPEEQYYEITRYSDLGDSFRFIRLNRFEFIDAITTFFDKICGYDVAINEIIDSLNHIDDVISAYQDEHPETDAREDILFSDRRRRAEEFPLDLLDHINRDLNRQKLDDFE